MANIKHKCPICKHDFSSKPKCGLRLFGSSNECPCCLESKNDMIALPCGHQICLTDLKRLGMDILPVHLPQTPRHPPPERPPPERPNLQILLDRRRQRRRLEMRVMRFNRSGRRCGWCGLQGHKISNCRKHRFQCGCRDFKTRRHMHILGTKHKCRLCNHKGHRASGCFNIVMYR